MKTAIILTLSKDNEAIEKKIGLNRNEIYQPRKRNAGKLSIPAEHQCSGYQEYLPQSTTLILKKL